MKITWKDASALEPRWKLPVASASLNRALDGGLESGRIHTFWGPKSSTKSSNALYAVAAAQQMGKICSYIDAEHTFDADYAAKCGVDLKALKFADEGTNIAEDLLEALIPDLQKDLIDVVIIDSLSSVIMDSFHDKTASNPMGVYARSSKFVLAKLLNHMDRSKQFILINHASMDLSGSHPMLTAQMGSAQGMWSSNIIGFKANYGRANFRAENGKTLDDAGADDPDGFRKVYWQIDKCKQPAWPLAGSYWFNGREAKVDNPAEWLDIALDYELLEKAGAWYSFEGQRWQGMPKLLAQLKYDISLSTALMASVAEKDAELRKPVIVDLGATDD